MSSPKAPTPTKQELASQQAQADMLNYQRGLLERQSAQQEMLAPLMYKQANLEPIYEQTVGPMGIQNSKIIGFKDLGPTDEQKAYKEQLAAQTRNMKFAEALTPLQLRQQGYTMQMDENGNPTSIDVIPGGPADMQAQLQGAQLKTANQQYEFNQQMLERAGKAAKGELPVDPGMQRQLDENEAQLHEQLRKNLGPGYATSTPGIEALSNFSKKKSELFSAVQHGEISSSANLAFQGQQVSPSGPNAWGTIGNSGTAAQFLNPFAAQGSPNARSAQLTSTVDAPYGNSGAFGTLAQNYGNAGAALSGLRTPPGKNRLIAGLGGAATGAFAGSALGPGGTAAGGVIGGVVGTFGT